MQALMENVKGSNTAQELLTLAQEAGIPMTQEEAEQNAAKF